MQLLSLRMPEDDMEPPYNIAVDDDRIAEDRDFSG
jgi:hypothetical protein